MRKAGPAETRDLLNSMCCTSSGVTCEVVNRRHCSKTGASDNALYHTHTHMYVPQHTNAIAGYAFRYFRYESPCIFTYFTVHMHMPIPRRGKQGQQWPERRPSRAPREPQPKSRECNVLRTRRKRTQGTSRAVGSKHFVINQKKVRVRRDELTRHAFNFAQNLCA
jgi:hypothetical protein